MNILFLSHQADFIYGGEISTLEMIRQLRDHHTIHFALPRGPYFDKVAQLVPAIELPSIEFSRDLTKLHTLTPALLATHNSLRKIIQDTGAEIIHATSLKSMVYAFALGVQNEVKVLWHHHDIMPSTLANKLWVKNLARGAGRIAVPSEACKRSLTETGISTDKITVVRNGFRPTLWKKRALHSDVDHRPFRVALVGEISHRKGSDLIAPLAAKLSSEQYLASLVQKEDKTKQLSSRPYEIVVIGEGLSDIDFAKDVRQSCTPFISSGLVSFMGRREDVPALLQNIDLVLVPSRQDPLPTVITEAFLSGIPVLASPVGGIPEMVLHDITGYLCAGVDHYAEHICELAHDNARWNRLSLAVRNFAETYLSAEQMRKTLDQIYSTF